MKMHSLGKGRKRIVENFTAIDGLWVLGLPTALMIALIVLWILGYAHLDPD
jgi:hypothetical protein